ncbi:MAG: cytochrome c-type biogenesis protein CcmH [Solirubrobacteraceae bacterium]
MRRPSPGPRAALPAHAAAVVAVSPLSAVVAILLGFCLLAPLAFGAGAADAASPTIRASLPVIERQVMCVTCKIPLEVAESPQADREREFIQGLIDEGLDEAQIKRALVAQYGPTVLALPSAHGFDLTVYLVPLAVFLVLLGTLAVLLPRWRRHARAQADSVLEAPPLDPAADARLDADLARFDSR